MVFTDIAHVHVSPELGKIAKDYIDYPDRKIAANAAYIFKWLGNADVETALWKNLDTWHKKWAANSGSIPFDEQNYQDSLVEALLLGGGPCKSKDTMDRLRPFRDHPEPVPDQRRNYWPAADVIVRWPF